MHALAHEARLALVALQYFTRLPVPALPQFDPRWLSQSVRYFPLAGLVVGALAASVLFAASIVLPWPLAAALEIMHDSRIGTYGGAALVLTLQVRWQALVALRLPEAMVLLVTSHAASRAGAALLMARLPYMRLDIDAKAKPVAQPMGAGQALATAAVGLLRRRLGGYTGDGLGATQQLAELEFAPAWIAALRAGL